MEDYNNTMSITDRVKDALEDYKLFTNITDFPNFDIVVDSSNIDETLDNLAVSLGSADYELSTGKQKLVLYESVFNKMVNPRSLLFHEFTHIYDDKAFINQDGRKKIAFHGVTEYHAAQIELLYLVGAASVNHIDNFSMNKKILSHFMEESIQEFLERSHQRVKEFINTDYYKTSIGALGQSLGAIFNYLGYVDVCERHATDYSGDCDVDLLSPIVDMALIKEFSIKMRYRLSIQGATNCADQYLMVISKLLPIVTR